MWHFKSGPYFEVALETSIGRSVRINDLALLTAGRNMETSRAVTRFAAHFLRVIAWRF